MSICAWRGSNPGIARSSEPPGCEHARDRRGQFRCSGYSGNFRHRASTSAFTLPSAASSSGDRQRARDELADDIHFRLAHAAAGDGGRADADAARDHRRVLIEGNRVLVDGDAGFAERRLRDLAGEPAREDVDEHQVIVGAAADQAEAGGRQVGRQPSGVGDDLPLIVGERRLQRFLEADRFGRDDVHQRAALDAREDGAIEILGVLLPAEDHPAARSAQRLVRRRRDEIGVRDRAGVHACRDQPGDVRHVGDDRRAHARRPSRRSARSR